MASDARLLKASLRGDHDAFGRIVRRYQSLVCAVTYSGTGDLAASEDLAQETFLAAWRKLDSLREPARLRVWLCAIARNMTAEYLRRRPQDPMRAPVSLDEAAPVPSATPGPAQRAITDEQKQLVWAALQEVPETYRLPLVLYYREQHSVWRVAQALGISRSAAKHRLVRGRRMVKERVASLVDGTLSATAPGGTFAAAVLAGVAGTAAQKAAGTGSTILGLSLAKATAVGVLAVGAAVGAAVALRRDAPEPTPAPAAAFPAPQDEEEAAPIFVREWVEVQRLDRRETRVFASPGDWLAIGDNLRWSYTGGTRLAFTREGRRVYVAADAGAPRLAGLVVEDQDDLAELAGLLAEESEPLTVWCMGPSIEGITALTGAEKIGSLCVSSDVVVTDLSPLTKLTGMTSLSLWNCRAIVKLAPLGELTQLQSLALWRYAGRDLAPLSSLTHLRSLDLFGCQNVRDFRALQGLAALASLGLRSCPGVDDLSSLTRLTNLVYLNMGGDERLADIGPLAKLTRLQELVLPGRENAPDLSPLGALPGLQALELGSTTTDQDLAAVAVACPRLQSLRLRGRTRVGNLNALAPLKDLTDLSVDNGVCLGDISGLQGLRPLRRLALSGARGLKDLSPLAGLSGLEALSLVACGISDLSPLTGLTGLRSLDIQSCDGVLDISPLLGLTALERLRLDGCDGLRHLPSLASLANLTELGLPPWTTNEDLAAVVVGKDNLTSLSVHAHAVWDLSAPASLTGLKELDLSNSVSVRDLAPLAALKGLTTLNLRDCESVTDLSPLAGLTELKDVEARGCGTETVPSSLRAVVRTGPSMTEDLLRQRGRPTGGLPSDAGELARRARLARGLCHSSSNARLLMGEDKVVVDDLERFYEAYRLAPNENFKLIGQPFIPERQTYYEWAHQTQAQSIRGGPGSFYFLWQGDHLWCWGLSFGGANLSRLLQTALDLGCGQIEGAAHALDRGVGADVVVRAGVGAEDMLPEIEEALLKEALLPVHLAFREIDGNAIVVSGSYRYQPQPDVRAESWYDEIHLYGSLPYESGRGGGGSGTFRDFLNWVGDYTGRQVFGEAQHAPGTVQWLDGPLPQGVRRGELPDEEAALVLQHLSEQTGLTFTEETRKIRVLHVDVDLPPDLH